MNAHLPMQPAIPLHNGRHQSDIPYPPLARSSHYAPPYHGYQNSYQHPQQYQQQHPPQWYQYQQMPVQVPRPYPHYAPMMNVPYQMHHSPASFPPRPLPTQHASSSSVHSHQDMLSPSSSSASLHALPLGPTNGSGFHLAPLMPPPPPSQRMPYYPPLPWYSFTIGSFPLRGPRRRRRKPAPQSSNVPVELPARDDLPDLDGAVEESQQPQETQSPEGPEPITSSLETPTTSHAPSEDDSTQPTTPSSVVGQVISQPHTSSTIKRSSRLNSYPLPIIPIIPNFPLAPRASKRPLAGAAPEAFKPREPSNEKQLDITIKSEARNSDIDVSSVLGSPVAEPLQSTKPPKSWADLVRTKAQPIPSNRSSDKKLVNGAGKSNGLATSKITSLAEALSSYKVEEANDDAKVSFVEPRGLVNTGNMCYMNSVLQILVFCNPFYDFLERIGRQAVHSFKTETPLVDAMILFIREFSIIDSAISVEQLRMRLKDNELEQYGDAFIPEFVYEVIRRLPRFASMRRGHQQDAEEFLGFLLEEMHDECSKAMKLSIPNSSGTSTPTNGIMSPISESTQSTTTGESGWLEVGPKQKPSITRSSGAIAMESPITKIFGGKLRSELRVPGMKNSVTFEPYQPLQLDIGSPNVHNIIDALNGLTRPETLHGDFNSPRGPGYIATKQVTIESLPQVLILHLKRFQYDNAGGTQKIWKKIGYPLELDLPKEIFAQHRRGGLLAHGGIPKYRLIGVVYHHGKNASGGHYTVDVRRQDGREWIRLDDTVIRRVRSEDVAEGGCEEDPKVLATALEQQKSGHALSGNVYDQLGSEGEDQSRSEKGWNQVTSAASASGATKKKLSGVADGTPTPINSSGKMTPIGRSSVKDNKVAYLLFYQRVTS